VPVPPLTAERAAARATPAAAARAPPAVAPLEIEFDGGATDVADIAVADFPVLTDAVEAPAAKPAEPPPLKAAEPPVAKPAAPAAKATAAPQAGTPAAKAAPPAAAAPAAKPAPKPASRVEPVAAVTPAKPTAAKPAPPKPAPSVQPTTTPLPHVAAAKPAAAGAGASRQPAADDEARQTQTVRAIAEAKSLDDLSDIDAETLFGDAELDLVSAALASAAEWPDDEEPTAAPTPARADTDKKAIVPGDEALDLFGLDADAPLELIDDATLPPVNPTRKTAAR
jgi:hypothetical protein